ncbi:hypothetical protein FBZ89_1427 [Nitrospirillum amazonense]|uniref:Relaxasome subunit MobC n=1 Tax=Nitrospirillum amazonense TaxID=28077 RepID=A0A560EIX2_9PROT|nr:mobilization protein C [Nitrospirillum amazonense]TWB09323.1 hypothetical protein FBZ89_1427 [Nitrospirillum amazonense]
MPPKSLDEQIADAAKRYEQLSNRKRDRDAAAKVRARKRDNNRKIVVGGAVLAHAKRDPAFAAQLWAVLDQAVTRAIDRKAIADLLPSAPAGAGEAA